MRQNLLRCAQHFLWVSAVIFGVSGLLVRAEEPPAPAPVETPAAAPVAAPVVVSEQAPGSSATLELWRQGKLRELVMKLGEVDSPVAQHKTMPGNSSKLGLAVRPLSTEERKNADVVYGLVIEEVATTGPATQAGLRRGDIILSVNGEKLSSAEQLRVLVEKNGKHLALQIQRGDNRMFVPLRIK